MTLLATESWLDEFHAGLADRYDQATAERLFARYGEAFPDGYRADYPPQVAVTCVDVLEEYLAAPAPQLRLIGRAAPGQRLEPDHDPRLVLIWPSPAPALLADVLPVMENLGLRIARLRSFDVTPADSPALGIEEFRLVPRDVALVSEPGVAELLAEVFTAVWTRAAEDDGFNELVLKARFGWREVAVLRAAYAYLQQAGITFGQAYAQRTLLARPDVARLLFELFDARCRPGRAPSDEQRARAAVESALDAVDDLSEDRMLRALLDVLTSVVRTNYYQRDADGNAKPWLVFKLDPAGLSLLPEPRPAVETFVHSPKVAGLHLRASRIARGGIRWSDRTEDFRTEVLGLMQVQQVKNAVIVPQGAKGAFVVKRPPSDGDAEELQSEVRACYSIFIRGLLDVTDNRVAGRVVPPPDVVCHDAADSYLVVAADKGTATFSDLANAIAAEYGFWLGDAFASGGATGYDHKALGITARGAWESLRRHFGELGIDPARDDFTVVGIGDMSGDVFGNGLLGSEHIRLLAAFDHRHIFLDPDPDPVASYAERRRLFTLARSSWADYDPAVISAGGGVFPRTAKSVPLSPEVRAALDIDAERLPADGLIKAILHAPVDLLFNGGIGTYVKATDEADAEVGDRANDGVRIDAAQLRARVVGEGGNLGLTQRARIEYALAGGRVNTDSIDNSAGVDISDREVNIKILLDGAVADGRLTRERRNRLLAEVAGEVTSMVLAGNYAQAQAISVSEALGALWLDRHRQVIQQDEVDGSADSARAFLPDQRAMTERQEAGRGLTRPELAVVLARCKTFVPELLLASDMPDHPSVAAMAVQYLPERLRAEFAEQVRAHPLHREIAVTVLVNELFNHMGSGLLVRLQQLTGRSRERLALVYVAARDVLGLPQLWADLNNLDVARHARAQTRALIEIRLALEQVAVWLVRHRHTIDPAVEQQRLRPGVRQLSGMLGELLPPGHRAQRERRISELVEVGAPVEVAESVAALRLLSVMLDVVEAACTTGADLGWLAALYLAVGERFDVGWLRDQMAEHPGDDHWATLAKASLRDELATQQCRLAVAAAAGTDRAASPGDVIDAWIERNGERVRVYQQTMTQLRELPKVDVPMVAVALEGLRSLATTGDSAAALAANPSEEPSPGGQVRG